MAKKVNLLTNRKGLNFKQGSVFLSNFRLKEVDINV